jgi:hypothetical protein
MNGHLGKQHSSVTLERRCQSALRAHVRLSTLRAQGNANGYFPPGAPCIWPLLRHLQGAYGRISTRAVGAPRFLIRLQHPTTWTRS